jgi:uncharacterized protein YjiS (DUF1127 family)
MTSYARRAETDRRDRHGMPPARTLRAAGARLILILARWQELARQRRSLLSLDDRMLKDIGITRADATREGTRPFWDVRGVDVPRY